jgi:hypothetical protein
VYCTTISASKATPPFNPDNSRPDNRQSIQHFAVDFFWCGAILRVRRVAELIHTISAAAPVSLARPPKQGWRLRGRESTFPLAKEARDDQQ